MSGGVDSSLAAALLVEQGHEVTGVYMKNWSKDLPGMKCPWAEDLADAKRVAVQLGIDFKVFDFEKEYKQKVVDYMLDEYQNGRTPNPDIMCNQEVKFKIFLEAALEDGAEMIATGHYARTESGRLIKVVDENKDQTYFLYRVTSEALEKTLFPLGNLTKSEVRDMAKDRGLYTAVKKESMGVCFVGAVGMREFLSEYVETKPGDIIDTKTSQKIGRHDGAIFYTIGQRHGLNVGGGLPYYVVGKDMTKNEVYVSTDLNNSSMWQDEIKINQLHWINQKPTSGTYEMRIRHRAPLKKVEVEYQAEDGMILRLDSPERVAAPGQSVVLYDGEICLGGGIIS
jgi:tRNA-specific 2-thiouridylase